MFKRKETENVISTEEATTKKGHPILKTLGIVAAAGGAVIGTLALIGKKSNDNLDELDDFEEDDYVVPFETENESDNTQKE